ncbi:Pregnancy-associated plasma protein-A [Chitinophaga sp. CF118]|uniref:zinc metalloprotease n=1 Tax=Chitinophaga sp. CF118 TaxID=1884367 RepID=UPI0008E20CAB|nr:zinc metalloprotease [Chitinophaga sp. CF118]SFD09086.1 Pregnancy-associated plasma protein-A [Chitinophaga sp. CF118]
MKKLSILVTCGIFFISACTKPDKNSTEKPATDNTTAVATERHCAAMDVLNEQLKNDPALASRMAAIEANTNRIMQDKSLYRLLPDGSIMIPVIVNVLYRTTAQNVSAAQIQSQIDVLNRDYNGLNSEYSTVPTLFSSVKASVGVHFVLKSVVRKSTTVTTWSTNDAMKKSAQGGINPTTPDSVLNIWVVGAMSGGVIGYAQFPGGASATDGVVIAYNCFGNTGTAAAPFGLGRTATHEIGHWLNLRHIWGDATCGTDLVGDTPAHNAANYGCPSYPHLSTCSGTPVEMTMNYMDYTDDACMYMFTAGQKTRMLATFVSGGGRYGFAQ